MSYDKTLQMIIMQRLNSQWDVVVYRLKHWITDPMNHVSLNPRTTKLPLLGP